METFNCEGCGKPVEMGKGKVKVVPGEKEGISYFRYFCKDCYKEHESK